MREISCEQITTTVRELCGNACVFMPEDTIRLLKDGLYTEQSPSGRACLQVALDNAHKAAETGMPICQDTGMVTVFAEIGQEVHITGGNFYDAVNEGVRQAYVPFRKSVLTPLERKNTGDNTPAVVHVSLCPGEKLHLTVAPKGFGSENMSSLCMLKPSQGMEGVKQFIVDTVSRAGSNPCPPMVVGVGIGGTFEKAALMAKHALATAKPSENPQTAQLEQQLLKTINTLGIGPQGLGGTVTALAVYIETYPTHIAGLPVAVNIQCHCARHVEGEL